MPYKDNRHRYTISTRSSCCTAHPLHGRMVRLRCFRGLMNAILAVATALSCVHAASMESPRILSGVDLSESSGPQSVMMVMKRGLELDKMSLDSTLPRSERREAVYRYLLEKTQRAQKCVRDALSKRRGDLQFQPFWITNAIAVRGIQGPQIRDVVDQCADDMEEVRPIGFMKRHAQPHNISRAKEESTSSGLQWNIQKIGADKAWANGHDGTGVVVATLDGGVRYTHDALVQNYRGTIDSANNEFDHNFNWKDWPYKNKVPFDSDGHGTNVQGILSGSKASGVGVAPGAKWISGKIFNYAGYSSNDWTLAGVQWAMCPTPLDSDSHANCSLGADVVSCSWGEDDATTGFLKDAIAAWLKAGMVPVFAVGNAGPKCNTVVSPADYAGVVSVGATDKDDSMVAFSSRGPGANGTSGALPYDPLTPNIVAPGLMIQGPSHNSDDGYKGFSGTSQAAPHVAGAAALLLSAHPSWSPQQIAEALYSAAVTSSLPVPDSGWDKCGLPTTSQKLSPSFPNFVAGHGRVDVGSV